MSRRADWARIVELWRGGLVPSIIAERLGLRTESVRVVLRRLGLMANDVRRPVTEGRSDLPRPTPILGKVERRLSHDEVATLVKVELGVVVDRGDNER